MDKTSTNLQHISFRPFDLSMISDLAEYLAKLSPETRKRFAPHSFTEKEIKRLFQDVENYKLFVAVNEDEHIIVAYTIIKLGWLEWDRPRLTSYGLVQQQGDVTLAPSVADAWQSKGVGSSLFAYTAKHLKKTHGVSRIILWGGVQSTNVKAMKFYEKFGFRKLGEFEHHGVNQDMLLEF